MKRMAPRDVGAVSAWTLLLSVAALVAISSPVSAAQAPVGPRTAHVEVVGNVNETMDLAQLGTSFGPTGGLTLMFGDPAGGFGELRIFSTAPLGVGTHDVKQCAAGDCPSSLGITLEDPSLGSLSTVGSSAMAQGSCTVTITVADAQGVNGSFSCSWTGISTKATGTFTTAATAAGPTRAPPAAATPSPTPGDFEVGIGCAEDGTVVRCTASVFDPPAGADLVYEWTVDSIVQAGATGSTLAVDLEAARIQEGDHVFAVTATDRISGASGSRGQTMRTTAKLFAVRPPACTWAEERGTYELTCATGAVNPPANANLVFDWTVAGQRFEGSESITRSVGQGAVVIGVSARDRVSGRTTPVASATVIVNPTGVITDILTGGQTSDPQNVIDELLGAGLGAAALAAGAAIAGQFSKLGGIAAGDGAPPSDPTAGPTSPAPPSP